MTILYKTQQEVLDKAKPSFLYELGTSSGKTLIAIYHYLKHSNGEPLLIIEPPAKLKTGEWKEEIKVVEEAEGIKIDFVEISVGVLAKRWKEFKGYFVVIDEAHLVKNPTSKRGKAAMHLTKASTNFILLTATSSATWEDTINYFIMWGFYKNKTQFLKEHAIYEDMYFGNRVVKKPVDFTDKEELIRKFNTFSVKKGTEHFVDLPATRTKGINFKKSVEYNKIFKDRVLETKEELILFDTQPKLLAGLRYYANQKDKLQYTEMVAEGTNENILIFYNFKKEREDLVKLAKKMNKKLYEVSGSNFELPTKEERKNLKDSITIVQYQSGSAAIELQYCSVVIIYTPSYSYIDHTQALGRAIRHGNDKKVTIYNYNTKGSVEEKVYQALETKKDFTLELFKKEVTT